jgi:hypothetical protein
MYFRDVADIGEGKVSSAGSYHGRQRSRQNLGTLTSLASFLAYEGTTTPQQQPKRL